MLVYHVELCHQCLSFHSLRCRNLIL